MRAATILAAINAMRIMDELSYSIDIPVQVKARAWNELASARNALEVAIEREYPEIKIERTV